MILSPKVQAFVLHFGEMGSRWGINRTVGQMYGLLIMKEKPLNADEISDALGVSRSNVSMGLKELQSWRLITPHHLPGDRKEYYSTPDDVWEIGRILIEERQKREIEPTLSMLRSELMREPVSEEGRYAQQRMKEMYELMEMFTSWTSDLQRINPESLVRLMKLGSNISKMIDIKDKMTGKKTYNDNNNSTD